MEVEPCINRTVNTLHSQRLVGSQSVQVRKVRLWRQETKVPEALRNSFCFITTRENIFIHVHVSNDCNAVTVTSKDDGVQAGFAPKLHEVDHVPEAQRRVTGEHHARLTELAAEVSVDTWVVLQLVGLDQLKG